MAVKGWDVGWPAAALVGTNKLPWEALGNVRELYLCLYLDVTGEGHRQGHAKAVQVAKHPRNSYLIQLRIFADILPAYRRHLNGTKRDGTYMKVASGHTGCDVARHNMTLWGSG